MIRVLQVMDAVDETTLELYRAMDHAAVRFDFWLHSEPRAAMRREIEELGGLIWTRRRLNWRGWQEITRAVRHGDYDAVHVHAKTPAQLTALAAARKGGATVRVLELGRGGWRADRRMRYATVLAAMNEETGKAAFGERPFLLRRELLDVSACRYDEEQRQSARSALDLEGRLVVGVTGEGVLPILEALRTYDESFRALFLDTETDTSWRDAMAAHGLVEQTLALGGRSDTASLLQALDVQICPSAGKHERLLLGAQAAGVPCLIAADTPLEIACPALVRRMETADAQVWAEAVLSARAENRGQYAAWVRNMGCDAYREAWQWAEIYRGSENAR